MYEAERELGPVMEALATIDMVLARFFEIHSDIFVTMFGWAWLARLLKIRPKPDFQRHAQELTTLERQGRLALRLLESEIERGTARDGYRTMSADLRVALARNQIDAVRALERLVQAEARGAYSPTLLRHYNEARQRAYQSAVTFEQDAQRRRQRPR